VVDWAIEFFSALVVLDVLGGQKRAKKPRTWIGKTTCSIFVSNYLSQTSVEMFFFFSSRFTHRWFHARDSKKVIT